MVVGALQNRSYRVSSSFKLSGHGRNGSMRPDGNVFANQARFMSTEKAKMKGPPMVYIR
jgi:hypothetical protein